MGENVFAIGEIVRNFGEINKQLPTTPICCRKSQGVAILVYNNLSVIVNSDIGNIWRLNICKVKINKLLQPTK